MNNLLLPDLLAIAILLGVLGLVRRRYPGHDFHLWMIGLLLILLECTARLLYGLPLPDVWHRILHVIALDAYLLAGVVFLRSAVPGGKRPASLLLCAIVNTIPALALMTEYGWGVQSAVVYLSTAAVGMVVAVASSLRQRRPPAFAVVGAAIWLPVVCALLARQPRLAAYLLLAALYLATAGVFFRTMPRRSSGKLLVVIGFTVWSGCFALHPWIATTHPAWSNIASEIWNMQKFLITTGFLLAMFERQVESNEWIALHDQLTGLPNRWLFHDRLANAIARAERDGTSLILFCLDLNFFKEVNDSMGHDAGDVLLRSVADNLQQVVRRTDTLARIGGDEFVLLATDVKGAQPIRRRERRWRKAGGLGQAQTGAHHGTTSGHSNGTGGNNGTNGGGHAVLHHASRIEQDIRAAVNKPVYLQGVSETRTVEMSVSVGIAIFPSDSTDAAELFRHADQRMYEDKRRQHGSRGLDRVLSLLSTT